MISWHPNQVGERMDSRAAVRGWHERLAQLNAPSANAITVDVEDYFQVEAFCSTISRNDWEAFEQAHVFRFFGSASQSLRLIVE